MFSLKTPPPSPTNTPSLPQALKGSGEVWGKRTRPLRLTVAVSLCETFLSGPGASLHWVLGLQPVPEERTKLLFESRILPHLLSYILPSVTLACLTGSSLKVFAAVAAASVLAV